MFEETQSTRNTRPVKNELLQRLRNKEFERVLVYKLDRWARSSSELILEINELVGKGIGFYSYSENLDFGTETGKLLFNLLSSFAEFERDIKTNNMITKIIVRIASVCILLTNSAYGQSISIKVDSLVISSLPFNLSPGLFNRKSEEIRGHKEIIIKDYTSISEFLKYVEPDMNSTEKLDVDFNPYVIVDVYFGNSFFTISMDQNTLFRYENKGTLVVNSTLSTWLIKRIYPAKK